MHKKFDLQTGRENACCDIVCRCSWEYNWISERSGGMGGLLTGGILLRTGSSGEVLSVL